MTEMQKETRAAKKKAMDVMQGVLNYEEGQTNISDSKYYSKLPAQPLQKPADTQVKYNQTDIKRFFSSPSKIQSQTS